jgi:sugar lactone lactonase YvrE
MKKTTFTLPSPTQACLTRGMNCTVGLVFAVLIAQLGACGGGSSNSALAIDAPPIAAMSVFAGDPVGGTGNLDGTPGSFGYLEGAAMDGAGNVYVTDSHNQSIRKITPGGVVSTLAGTGATGATDGAGNTASFNNPIGVATDSAGNVYVVDSYNNVIRKITPLGVVSTLAGSSATGAVNGTGGAASFNNPSGLATDGAGNLYVGDILNHLIRKITPSGVVSTLAGSGVAGSADGTGTAASFNRPTGVAIDSTGNVYVADAFNHLIRKITPGGLVSTLAGSGVAGATDGTGSAASFNRPSSVSTDGNGNVYATDNNSNTIRKITALGVVSTLAGTAGAAGSDDGTGAAARFTAPQGLAADSLGNLVVADSGNQTVRKITAAGVVSTIAGIPALHGSTDGIGAAARFLRPKSSASDSAGNLYVADSDNQLIRKITPAGVVSTLAGSGVAGSADGTGSAASFNYPFGIATDSAGTVYVAGTFNHTIRKITPLGVVTTLAGTTGVTGSANGTGAAARFSRPYGLATDVAGNVYVADSANNLIRKITPSGVVSTLAGSGVAGSADGTGSAASFTFPEDIASDSAGNLYVAATTNHVIRKITPDGVVTTLAGSVGMSGSADGTAGAARFNLPTGVATDSAGNLYVADAGNYLIRVINTSTRVVTTLAGALGKNGFSGGALPGTLPEPAGMTVSGTTLYFLANNGMVKISNAVPTGN